MGDRVNIGFRNGGDPQEPIIFLYSHWGGETVNPDVRNALIKANNRWNDYGYATRIAISSIVGSQWESETGFGIYVDQVVDPNRPTVVINWGTRTVTWYSSNDIRDIKNEDYDLISTLSNFINPIKESEIDLEDPRISEFNR